MRKTFTIFILTAFILPLRAQVQFKTVVPARALVTGESFQVQYVLEGINKTVVIRPPDFSGFRFITGPNIYTGMVPGLNGPRPVQNFVYTLEAAGEGKRLIPGAGILVDGKVYKSEEATVEIISARDAARLLRKREDALNTAYFLRPGEDPYEKIRQNLFLKVGLDKTSCYAGEPIVATYKLYSRLESKSDIVKNPGFYGFAVYDMVNLSNKKVSTEQVNGQLFDVHTVRQVQLYPLQAGTYTIDPMEMKNRVEFSRSAVNKRTEQEIVEGMFGQPDDAPRNAATEVFESAIKTEPLTVSVKPVNAKNKPADYNGAVGAFTISSRIHRTQLSRNEEGVLDLMVSGHGNFIQLSPPEWQGPAGVEWFGPEIRDSLDKTRSPLSGYRVFRYRFVSSLPGDYVLPAVHFSFFDPAAGIFKTVVTEPGSIRVSNEERNNPAIKTTTAEKTGNLFHKKWQIAGILLFVVVVTLSAYYFKRGKNKETPLPTGMKPPVSIVNDMLAPAAILVPGADQDFFISLRLGIWNFFGYYYPLSGSGMNKGILFGLLRDKAVGETLIAQLENLLQQCEVGIYTPVSQPSDKSKLLSDTKELLLAIEKAGLL